MKEEVLKELLETIKDTKSFVLDQAPDVAQEMIFLARIESIIMLIGSLFLFYLLFYFRRKLYEIDGFYANMSMVYTYLSLLSPIIGVFGLEDVFSNLSCWVAPKYFLLEELSKLI